MPTPRVSILIPTLDAERDLAHLLPALEVQRLEGERELVVIDSDSTDCTRQLLRGAGVEVERIPRESFRHGATRNALAEMARGELLVFLSQDALPEGEDFLECLLAPLEDPDVAGTTARVLPHPGDDPLTARTVLDAPEASSRSEIRSLAWPSAFDALTPAERARTLRFNNVASAIRASVLREIPFPDLSFGEDFAWAARALSAGWKLAFVAEAVVRHAHSYTPSEAFERYRVDAAFHREIHDYRLRRGPWEVLRGIVYEVLADVRHVARQRSGWHHLVRSPALRSGQVLGQWFGSHGWLAGRRAARSTARWR